MSILDNTVPLLAAAIVGAWKVEEKTRELKGRTMCLRAVKDVLAQFYDLSERLLSDPAMPDPLKSAIYNMTFAVTDEQAGRKSIDTILDVISRSKEPSSSPNSNALESVLASLRKERGDLYDDFQTAIRTAIMALVLLYGPNHSKVTFEMEATRNTSVMLAITNKLASMLSDWLGSTGDRSRAAA